VCNVEEKMLKDGIIGQVESQTLELGLAQNFK
jgi:hypothetical protein